MNQQEKEKQNKGGRTQNQNEQKKKEDKERKDFSIGHRERLRKRFQDAGMNMESFTEQEKIEILLFYSIPRRDTKIIANRLLNKFGGFSGIFMAEYDELCKIDGMGYRSAELIKIVLNIIDAYMNDIKTIKNVLTKFDEAMEFIECQFIKEKEECVYLICMSGNGKILSIQRVAEGSPETVSIVPLDLMKRALRSDAAKVIIAHNHPNGISTPSAQDLRTTSILYDEFQRVDIELVDHIIVAPDGPYSMKKNHMFPAGGVRF